MDPKQLIQAVNLSDQLERNMVADELEELNLPEFSLETKLLRSNFSLVKCHNILLPVWKYQDGTINSDSKSMNLTESERKLYTERLELSCIGFGLQVLYDRKKRDHSYDSTYWSGIQIGNPDRSFLDWSIKQEEQLKKYPAELVRIKPIDKRSMGPRVYSVAQYLDLNVLGSRICQIFNRIECSKSGPKTPWKITRYSVDDAEKQYWSSNNTITRLLNALNIELPDLTPE